MRICTFIALNEDDRSVFQTDLDSIDEIVLWYLGEYYAGRREFRDVVVEYDGNECYWIVTWTVTDTNGYYSMHLYEIDLALNKVCTL